MSLTTAIDFCFFAASATAFCEVLNENLQRVESAHAGPYERDRGASVSEKISGPRQLNDVVRRQNRANQI